MEGKGRERVGNSVDGRKGRGKDGRENGGQRKGKGRGNKETCRRGWRKRGDVEKNGDGREKE